MEKEATSEEKLLRLLRKKKSISSAPLPEEKRTAAVGVIESKDTKARIDLLKWINRLLFVICLVIIAYIVNSYVLTKGSASLFLTQEIQPKVKEKDVRVSTKEDAQTFDFYAQTIHRRNLFLPPWEKDQGENKVAEASNSDLEKDIRLVGIVLDKNPKAIVEDVKSEDTSFLSIGDEIRGAKLIEVLEGKAIFDYNGQKVEIIQ